MTAPHIVDPAGVLAEALNNKEMTDQPVLELSA